MPRSCMRCAADIPDTPANRTRKRCPECAVVHHREQTAVKRSQARRERTWSEPFTCPICRRDFMQEQRAGAPARYCPDCTAVRRFGSAK